jgi:ABC-type bacteriocin/lantibiotic exporter with double-glycine peptidase domain
MVLAYWGQARTQVALSHVLGTDPDCGTPASRVLRLRSSALVVSYLQASQEDTHRWLEDQVPVIALVHTAELPYWSERCAHAVVVVGMDDAWVWVNDPAFEKAPHRVSAGDFALAREVMDNYVAVLRPAS